MNQRLARAAGARRPTSARSPWIERLARAGFAARGTLYVLIGVLALYVAAGHGRTNASQQGAVHTIAGQPFGKALLVLLAIGLFGYALWQFIRGVLGTEQEGGERAGAAARAGDLLSAGSYAALLYFTIGVLTGSGGSSAGSGGGGLLGGSGGAAAVTILGLALIGVGAYFAYRGWTEKFMKHFKTAQMQGSVETAVRRVGKAGNIARGVVFGIVGGFMVHAAVSYHSDKPVSLDAALHKLANHPYGTFLLAIVAAGLVCFGVYSFAEARYRRV